MNESKREWETLEQIKPELENAKHTIELLQYIVNEVGQENAGDIYWKVSGLTSFTVYNLWTE